MKTRKYNKEVKCIVWDLDNTLWDGTLLESDSVKLKEGIKEIIISLDSRGILNSVASKNNYNDAMAKMKEFDIDQYFIFPEINWNAKSSSIKRIQKNLNVGMDTIVFIDDQPFERDEVVNIYPEVETLNASVYKEILEMERFNPKFITKDSMRRRSMYIEEMVRNKEEIEYVGPKEEFLASLKMEFIISEANKEDLKRAEELTVRTNQLNATGKTYNYHELYGFMNSAYHKLYICELKDRYGSYGKIGLALIEINDTHWYLKMLLMSCRVLNRSVGSVFMSYIMQQTKNEGKLLLADFKQTDRNKMMYVTYRFANFYEKSNDKEGNILFENDLTQIPKFPHYIEIQSSRTTYVEG